MQPNLPIDLGPHSGFRLAALEILRWGTFDGDRFHKIELDGFSGCVTGPNGGGKSTAVDALLTLLVPPDCRHYNVAASSEGKKKERTVKTYIRGAWSRTESVETGKGQASFLREAGVPSVLLAVFKDTLLQKALTLVQIHWVNTSGQHEARYLVRHAEAHIPDLKLGVNQVTHRKPFEDAGWYYGLSFDEYMGKFRPALRIPDERALRLLCRTVSMKDITDLNVFVRELMLEPREPGVLLDDLCRHYENLHKISQEIAQAEEENRLLAPVERDFAVYERERRETGRLIDVKRAAEVYFAREHGRLLDAEVERIRVQKETSDHAAAEAKLAADRATGDYWRLKAQLDNHDVGKAIAAKTASRERLAAERQQRVTDGQEYHRQLALIGHVGTVENETTFNQVREKALAGKNAADTAFEKAIGAQNDLVRERTTLSQQIEKIEDELRLLGAKNSKIPPNFLRVRERLAQSLKLPEGELPFVGELIDVKSEEAKWRPTIERFIRSFALSLVVPEDRYAVVSDYLEHNDPGLNIVYYPVRRGTGVTLGTDPSRISGKIHLRPNSWAANWLAAELYHRFNHVCTDDMAMFRKEDKAITRQLHGKSGGGRNARYTQSGADDTDYDILGWSTAEKRARLDEQFRRCRLALDKLQKDQDAAGQAKLRAQNEGLIWGKIFGFSSYSAIDFATLDAELEMLRSDIERLTSASNEYKELETQVKAAENYAAGLSDARTLAEKEAGGFAVRLKERETERANVGKKFNQAAADDFPWMDHIAAVEGYLKELLSLLNVQQQHSSVVKKLDGQIGTARGNAETAKTAVEKQIVHIKAVCGERAFAKDITASIEAAPDLLDYRKQLENEALPELRHKFDEMMQENLLKHVFTLNAELFRQISDINDRITEVNETLATIDYSAGTYVRLRERETADKNVANFRGLLHACLVRQTLQTPEEVKESFSRLEALITFVKENREAALVGANTNHWLTFAVIESERVTNQQVTISSDSAGDSGGQKAKLAFTILAAALCFQFKHSRQRDSNAFRLVMVDEMFSKSDDENSRYALELFTRFDFQLLLVTPMEGKARLPMPYVKTYHLVSNPTKKASTITQATVEMVTAKEKELLARRTENAD